MTDDSRAGAWRWNCAECRMDVCGRCVPRPVPLCKKCSEPMAFHEWLGDPYKNGWICDNFRSCGFCPNTAGRSRWNCRHCLSDLCIACEPAPLVTSTQNRILPALGNNHCPARSKNIVVRAGRPQMWILIFNGEIEVKEKPHISANTIGRKSNVAGSFWKRNA